MQFKDTSDTSLFRSRKDTKKWCKGKEGVSHDYQLIGTKIYTLWPPEMLGVKFVCENCKKRLSMWYER